MSQLDDLAVAILEKYDNSIQAFSGLLLADVHELHANAPMRGNRTSFVFYAREGMAECGTAAEELHHAQDTGWGL